MYGLAAVSLRYFNVGGAHTAGDGRVYRERHTVETHLIPNILAVALGGRESVSVFGTDYPTPDGTCVRDYIHVSDLAGAHLLALAACSPGEHRIYNLGSGTGFSVQEVLSVCREVTGHEIPAVVRERRAGDPAVLVASSDKIQRELGWKPEHPSIRDVVADAWAALRADTTPPALGPRHRFRERTTGTGRGPGGHGYLRLKRAVLLAGRRSPSRRE